MAGPSTTHGVGFPVGRGGGTDVGLACRKRDAGAARSWPRSEDSIRASLRPDLRLWAGEKLLAKKCGRWRGRLLLPV